MSKLHWLSRPHFSSLPTYNMRCVLCRRFITVLTIQTYEYSDIHRSEDDHHEHEH